MSLFPDLPEQAAPAPDAIHRVRLRLFFHKIDRPDAEHELRRLGMDHTQARTIVKSWPESVAFSEYRRFAKTAIAMGLTT